MPKCVKCLGSHLSSECNRKERDTDVKCTNCSGSHPANYKGCPAYRELRKKLYPALRQRRENNARQINSNPPVPGSSSRQSNTNAISYRNVVRGLPQDVTQPSDCNK
uniref:Uncharacterized protein n=1 Tax=Phlebotomus papatasi TaxID=29031 RepID=A0A1B0DJ48_PHLPP